MSARVEVIVTARETPAALAVKRGNNNGSFGNRWPVGDPVGSGIVAELGWRPGGNITGFKLTIALDLEGKRLELLRELVPTLAQVAVFW